MLNDDLRNLLIDNRNKTQGAQIGLVKQLFGLGEYQADAADSPKIQDVYEVFNNYKTQLPYSNPYYKIKIYNMLCCTKRAGVL